MTTAFIPRLPPIVRGACAAVKSAPPPLPEAPASPPEDAPVEEVLAEQAEELAAAVEAASPETMAAIRAEQWARSLEAALDAVIRDNPLDEKGLIMDGKPAPHAERARALGRRGARCGGSAARLKAYLRTEGHPHIGELRDLHDRLLAEQDRCMAESRALQAGER